MQRPPMTMEEQLLQKAIKEECPWENLPKRLQATLATKDEWHRRITEYCIKKRLQWEKCSARKVCKESEYYEDMMRYLRKNLGLFPYHLAEYVCRVMRLSPFRYYCDMLFEVMKNEQPYDSIPNFSAADALRLTGIGRNEFIDIMNKCRSKKIMWKLNKSIAKELLPTLPVEFSIEPWWGVCLVNFTLEEFKKLSEEEMTTIDKICKEEANSYILFDADVIKGLYQRGLIYFDVPVYPEDRFKVSRLEGFVSNREQLYEDPIEELLYAVFVASSDNSTVSELASTLQADLSQLQAACSFSCRLGWAVKYIDPGSVLQDASVSVVSKLSLTDDDNQSYEDENDQPFDPKSTIARVAFIVDANITSYLMMGSVSPGLKSHAVTLYEAGKLGHASIADLCRDLGSLEGAKFEGELQEFANHAFSLRCFLECLLSGGVQNDEAEAAKRQYQIDILRCESLATLSPATLDRLFLRDYDMIVSMVPLSLSAVLPGPKGPIHFGPPSHSFLTPWMKLVLYSVAGVGPLSVVFMKGQCLRLLPAPLAGCERALIWSWDGSNVGGLGTKFDGNLVKGGVLLHCVNALLKYSAVLVLPLSKRDLDDSKKPVTVDVPLPLIDSGDISGCLRLELGFSDADASEFTSMLDDLRQKVNLSTIGYLRLLKLFNENESAREYRKFDWVPLSIEYGVPLFSRGLCKSICRRVVSSGLLQSSSLTGHQEAMHELRRRVGEMCVEYQATGTAAKVLYQKEKAKGTAAKLMNYASGKWNPLLDPSSPISGACSERQRLMLANRHRCKTEVLSFDGSVLRSYALPPVYEASSTQIEEASLVNTLKAEFNEGDAKEVIFPGVNLLFDGSQLHPFDVGACLQARQPVALVADAASISASIPVPK